MWLKDVINCSQQWCKIHFWIIGFKWNQEPLHDRWSWQADCMFTTSLTAVTQTAVVLASCSALRPGQPSDPIEPSGRNSEYSRLFENDWFLVKLNWADFKWTLLLWRSQRLPLKVLFQFNEHSVLVFTRLVFATCMISRDHRVLGSEKNKLVRPDGFNYSDLKEKLDTSAFQLLNNLADTLKKIQPLGS